MILFAIFVLLQVLHHAFVVNIVRRQTRPVVRTLAINSCLELPITYSMLYYFVIITWKMFDTNLKKWHNDTIILEDNDGLC